MPDPNRSTVILGLGNLLRRDDGVGVHVVRRLRSLDLPARCALKENPGQWLLALEQIAGFDRAMLIDAAELGRPAGTIVELSLADVERSRSLSVPARHGENLTSAMRIGRALGLELPTELRIIAIQVADVESFEERCSPQVEKAIGAACDLVQRWALD